MWTLATTGHAVQGSCSQLAQATSTSPKHLCFGDRALNSNWITPENYSSRAAAAQDDWAHLSCCPQETWTREERKRGLESSPAPQSKDWRNSLWPQGAPSQRLVKAVKIFVSVTSQAEKESSMFSHGTRGSTSSNLIRHQRTTGKRCSNRKKNIFLIYKMNIYIIYELLVGLSFHRTPSCITKQKIFSPIAP